jgi:alcohol dehydrogenase class IV
MVSTSSESLLRRRNAGYTSDQGHKVGVNHPDNVPRAIIYDAEITLHTPNNLWVSSGVRALDHSLENLYREGTPGPSRVLCREALGRLFLGLRQSHANAQDVEARQACFEGAWMS